jgi:GT2 family glycosyltransferase
VVVVNYNCKKWFDRFFPSLKAQTIFDRLEIIMVDNTSTDGSAELCRDEMAKWPNGEYLATGGNYGYGGGCNRGAAIAKGKYLFFLNPDVWLEPNCLEELVKGIDADGGSIASPRILDYDSDNLQSQGAAGFDMFGCMTTARDEEMLLQPFAVAAFYFITQELLLKVGGFDEEFFLYNEEMDLSWRAWLAGEPIRQVASARIHHQGVSSGNRTLENRTSEIKRFYANRNQMLTILKNAHSLLLMLALSQAMLIATEALVGVIITGRFSFVRWSLLKPLAECWRLRGHLRAERERIRTFRQSGDLWILRRFFTFGFGRWADVRRLLKSGVKIDRVR